MLIVRCHFTLDKKPFFYVLNTSTFHVVFVVGYFSAGGVCVCLTAGQVGFGGPQAIAARIVEGMHRNGI